MDNFQLSDELKSKLLSPFWTPPEGAKMPKRGVDPDLDGIWDEPVVIENFTFQKEENGDEVVYISVRCDMSTETTNGGQSHRERIWFPAAALQKNAPDNMVQAFTFSYRKLIGAYHAAGNEGKPSPQDIDPDSMRGVEMMVTVKVAPDKQGVRRQEIVGWTPPQVG